MFACALTLFCSAPVQAAIEVTGDIYAGAFDKYLWRGADLSGGKAVAQGGLDLSLGAFTFSYWTNVQLSKAPGLERLEGNETDLTLDYAVPLGEGTTLNLGNVFYSVDGVKDTNELYVGLSSDTFWAPELKAYYDYDEFRDDRFYTVALAPSLELGGGALNLGALASYADGDTTHEPWHAEFSAGIDIPLNEQIQLTPSFLYSTPLGDDAREALDDETAAGLSVTLNF